MTERPILFSAPMVRAILDGRKNQTRRVLKRLRKFGSFSGPITEFDVSDTKGYDWHFRDKGMRWHDMSNDRLLELCPNGIVGDRLWVKETFHAYHWDKPRAVYRADGELVRVRTKIETYEVGKWTPSIFMPRWASRILLEVTNVSVERLRDISEEDAIAEGAMRNDELTGCADDIDSCVDAYRIIWESINGKGSWDINPWVWVIKFKRIG